MEKPRMGSGRKLYGTGLLGEEFLTTNLREKKFTTNHTNQHSPDHSRVVRRATIRYE
jgi:hypothetical protein